MSLIKRSRTGAGVWIEVDRGAKQRTVFKRPELHPAGSARRKHTGESAGCAREGIGQNRSVLAKRQIGREAERDFRIVKQQPGQVSNGRPGRRHIAANSVNDHHC